MRLRRVSPAAALAAVSLVAGVLFVAPMAGKGWVLQVDWITGPHPDVPRVVWGLDTGPVYGPWSLAVLALGRVVGRAAMGWLPYLAFFPLAALGARRLVGGPATRYGPAALLLCVNPFVFERVASGQVVFLFGYALLPWLAASLLRALDATGPARFAPVAWIVLSATVLPHFAWLGAVLVVGVVVAARFSVRGLAWGASLAVGSLLAGAHLVLPHLGRDVVALDDGQLSAFATRADPALGLYGNVAALYGFFRLPLRLPKQVLDGWPFVLAALLLVVAVGARAAWRAGPRERDRRLVLALGVAAAGGFVLALGTQGPLGGAYRWAAFEVPGFAAMREPQKFVALVALFYAAAFGFGVEALVRSASRRAAAWQAVAVAGLVLVYTPNFFWGLGDQLHPSRYPAGWHRADRAMGTGDGRVLVLPWHKFMRLPFSHGRIVENPAGAFFRREVVSGDNVELPGVPTTSPSPRSRAVEALLAGHGSGCPAGRVLAPLGVEYVMLAKAVDWSEYAWLDRQPELQVVADDADVTLYRNLAYAGAGYRVPGPPVPALPATCPPPPPPRPAAAAVQRPRPVEFSVEPGPPGHVVLPEPYDRGWRMGGARPVPLAGGVLGFPVDGGGATATFRPFRRVAAGYAISGVVLAALGAACWVARRRRGAASATSSAERSSPG